jgi:chromate reductase
MSHDVAMLVGSLRRDSFNRKTANTLKAIAPPALALEVVEIGSLPLYNMDLESEVPGAWRVFRDRIRRADAILFLTPEYNRSVPGVLKNALDVGSRPPQKSVWKGKPTGIISVTTGKLGAFGANHHLRQSLVTLDMPTLPQPEIYIASVADLFDGDRLVADDTRLLLSEFLESFEHWIDRFAKVEVRR